MDILQVKKEGVTPNSEKEVNIYEKKEVIWRKKEKKKQNEKERKITRKWNIFVLTGRFCCYFIQQALPAKQT